VNQRHGCPRSRIPILDLLGIWRMLDRSHNQITPFSRILRLFVRQNWAIISLKFMRILTSKNWLNLMTPHY
jgi:hypothetical protein